MKHMQVFLTASIFALCLFGGKPAVPADWGWTYIEATGMAAAPPNARALRDAIFLNKER
jgi:hypothetical protein